MIARALARSSTLALESHATSAAESSAACANWERREGSDSDSAECKDDSASSRRELVAVAMSWTVARALDQIPALSPDSRQSERLLRFPAVDESMPSATACAARMCSI